MKKREALFKNATGKMKFTLTNDYLFRATWQKNQKALKGLICSIIGLKYEDVLSIEIVNPIELGKCIDAKDFVLDIRVLLNNDTIVNLEMQILNLGNWPERSLSYLCRSFDKLNSGDDYMEVKPVIQVCFLDFTLFKEYPEFFSTYMFINVKNHIVYSDKLKLYVVDLTCMNKATEEDKNRGIYDWARFFKATTWEEIKMLAEYNVFLEEAAETVYQLSAEEKIRMQCEAREDYYRQQRYIQHKLDKLKELEDKEEKMLENVAILKEEKQLLKEEKQSLEEEKQLLKEEKQSLEEEKQLLKEEKRSLETENKNLLESNREKDEEIVRLKEMLAKMNR